MAEIQRTPIGDTSERSGGIVNRVKESATAQLTNQKNRGTDALGQVVTLDTASAHTPLRFREALNHFLPQDVAVRAAREVASDFDPRRHRLPSSHSKAK